MDIDAVKLVSLIEARPQIYNYNHKEHADRIVIECLWREIATEMDCDASKCRNKWTNLRNSYTRYLREEKIKPTGPYGKERKKWYLVDDMSFLRDYINPHHSANSSARDSPIESKKPKTETKSYNRDSSIQSKGSKTSVSETSNSTRHNPIQSKRAETNATETARTQFEEFLPSRKKEETSEDGNTLFFKSMRADYEKLSCRGQRAFKLHMLNKMNELLEAEEESLYMTSSIETSDVKYIVPSQHTNSTYQNWSN